MNTLSVQMFFSSPFLKAKRLLVWFCFICCCTFKSRNKLTGQNVSWCFHSAVRFGSEQLSRLMFLLQCGVCKLGGNCSMLLLERSSFGANDGCSRAQCKFRLYVVVGQHQPCDACLASEMHWLHVLVSYPPAINEEKGFTSSQFSARFGAPPSSAQLWTNAVKAAYLRFLAAHQNRRTMKDLC